MQNFGQKNKEDLSIDREFYNQLSDYKRFKKDLTSFFKQWWLVWKLEKWTVVRCDHTEKLNATFWIEVQFILTERAL